MFIKASKEAFIHAFYPDKYITSTSDTVKEITSIISQKKNEAEHYKINSENGPNVLTNPSGLGDVITFEIDAVYDQTKLVLKWLVDGVEQSSLENNTTGSYNACCGTNAMTASTTGGGNSAFGKSALGSNTTGNDNSALGLYSLGSKVTTYSYS